jgi:hypothetical protein
MSEFVHTSILCKIIDPAHPHANEYAHPVGEGPDTITKNSLGQVQLKLINCVHGVDGCFAQQAQLIPIRNNDEIYIHPIFLTNGMGEG